MTSCGQSVKEKSMDRLSSRRLSACFTHGCIALDLRAPGVIRLDGTGPVYGFCWLLYSGEGIVVASGASLYRSNSNTSLIKPSLCHDSRHGGKLKNYGQMQIIKNREPPSHERCTPPSLGSSGPPSVDFLEPKNLEAGDVSPLQAPSLFYHSHWPFLLLQPRLPRAFSFFSHIQLLQEANWDRSP